MSRWPIAACPGCLRAAGTTRELLTLGCEGSPVEVIPADLGRELYEAAKLARAPIVGDSAEDLAQKAREALHQIQKALNRYEQEVGA